MYLIMEYSLIVKLNMLLKLTAVYIHMIFMSYIRKVSHINTVILVLSYKYVKEGVNDEACYVS